MLRISRITVKAIWVYGGGKRKLKSILAINQSLGREIIIIIIIRIIQSLGSYLYYTIA